MIGPPLMHGAAQWASFIMLGMGSAIIVPDEPRRFEPHDFLSAIERERAMTCTIVGDAFARPLLDQLAKALATTSRASWSSARAARRSRPRTSASSSSASPT